MSEQRKNARRELPSIDPENLEGLSYIANISTSGAFIKTNQLREIGSSMGITIKLPLKNSPPIRANCIVRWRTEYESGSAWKGGMGVEFKEISPKSKEWIHRYIESMSQKESIRKFHRDTAKIQVDYQHHDSWIKGISGNLSAGGIFLQTTKTLPISSTIQLKLQFPSKSISAQGKVNWINEKVPSQMDKMVPPGMGIEFASLKPADKEFIGKYIQENKKS
jgi:uncharacterized protein (TIGR02266 family)